MEKRAPQNGYFFIYFVTFNSNHVVVQLNLGAGVGLDAISLVGGYVTGKVVGEDSGGMVGPDISGNVGFGVITCVSARVRSHITTTPVTVTSIE